MIAVFTLAGGFVATYLDILGIGRILDSNLVFGIYALICLVSSFPFILLVNIARSRPKNNKSRKSKAKIDTGQLRLADGMPQEAIWREYEEHSLTIINDTGYDIKKCYIMLDEVAWKNFRNRWEVVKKDVFSQPFKWNNKVGVLDGKIDIDSGDRASFVFISHNEYSVYNSTKKQNETTTDFDFVFLGDEHFNIGYGSNIRLRISIRGKDENGESFNPIIYLLYVHLKQHHGIPKVEVLKRESIGK